MPKKKRSQKPESCCCKCCECCDPPYSENSPQFHAGDQPECCRYPLEMINDLDLESISKSELLNVIQNNVALSPVCQVVGAAYHIVSTKNGTSFHLKEETSVPFEYQTWQDNSGTIELPPASILKIQSKYLVVPSESANRVISELSESAENQLQGKDQYILSTLKSTVPGFVDTAISGDNTQCFLCYKRPVTKFVYFFLSIFGYHLFLEVIWQNMFTRLSFVSKKAISDDDKYRILAGEKDIQASNLILKDREHLL